MDIFFCNFFISKYVIIQLLFKAPDRNPENIKIQGHLPHQMDISWEVRKTAFLFIRLYTRNPYSMEAFSEISKSSLLL